MVATFGRTFCGHRDCNVVPIAETTLLYQFEQMPFFARRPIRIWKHFDIVMGDDVRMRIAVCWRFGATRKTFQAAAMLGRRTFGARNEWLVQCALANGTVNRTAIVPCMHESAISGCRRRNRIASTNAH